jgi:hypothetical protein
MSVKAGQAHGIDRVRKPPQRQTLPSELHLRQMHTGLHAAHAPTAHGAGNALTHWIPYITAGMRASSQSIAQRLVTTLLYRADAARVLGRLHGHLPRPAEANRVDSVKLRWIALSAA